MISRLRILPLFSALCFGLMGAPVDREAPAKTAPVVREPAVAGLFYPRDPRALAAMIDRLLGQATTQRAGRLRALICPHAGYEFSGPVAASGFHLLKDAEFPHVVLLAPSHYAELDQGSVSSAQLFRTPLGDVPISPIAAKLAQVKPFALEPRCRVERPEWAAQSSRVVPKRETADTWEHADEVEVPFLQKTLPRFDLVPVVCGDLDPRAAAKALHPFIDERTLLLVSSDLSHYHPYDDARKLDRATTDAVCALDVKKMEAQEACGRIPILILLHLAKERGWRPVLLDYRNSGDTTGDKARVVGYAAIAFYAADGKGASQPTTETRGELSAPEQQFLLTLARQSLEAAVMGKPAPTVPRAELTPALTAPKGCFVTLTQRGELRGCIGYLAPVLPLYQAVIENAKSAALHDTRFPPVSARELKGLDLEVSVLSEPQPLAFTSPDDLLRKLQPHRDGVILQVGDATSTYLPEVWEQISDKQEFMDTLAEKAGLFARAWRRPEARVSIYHATGFRERTR